MKLVFLHGSGGRKNSWYYQSAYFEDSDAVTWPGHPEGQPLATVEECVDWLRHYIHSKGHRDVILVGHSLGGATALMYAVKYPEDLKAIVVMSAGAKLRVHPKILAHFERSCADKDKWAVGIASLYERVDPALKDMLMAETIEIGPEVQLNDFCCVDGFDVMDKVHEIKLPTLVMCGSDDTNTPVKYAKFLAQKIQVAREAIIEGGTHLVGVERPKEVNRAIEEFLHSLQGGPN